MDATGLEIRDVVDATSENEAQRIIREKGYFVTKLSKKKVEKEKVIAARRGEPITDKKISWKVVLRSPLSRGIFWGLFFQDNDHIFFAPIPGIVFEICKIEC